MKRAFFVLGAQGSGTRMLTQAFIEAGCRGSAEHQQPMGDLDFSFVDDQPLVFRRSLPHGGEWPDLTDIVLKMQGADYEVQVIWIQRKSDFLRAHQLREDREHGGKMQAPYAVGSTQVYCDLRDGLVAAYHAAERSGNPLIVVPYEWFCMSTESGRMIRESFFRGLGLDYPQMDFQNSNEHPRYSDVKALTW